MFRRLIRRITPLLGGSRVQQELDEEMELHLQLLTEDLIRQGMEPGKARKEARIRFGSRARVQSRTREAQGMAFFDEAVRNVRFALRGMVRSPLFAGTFVLTLALCIGLGVAVFSVVDAVLWRSLPYPDPDCLAHAVLYNPSLGKTPENTGVDGRTWERLRDEAGMVERAVYSAWVRGVNLSTDRAAAYVGQQRVGAGYFRTLGVLPRQGREFEAAEDVPGGAPVAILSHELWTRTFQEDPNLLGGTIRLKGESHTVVGIMPPGFRSPGEADVWTPLRPSTTGEGGGTNYAILVRVPEGMSMEEADARMAAIEPPRSPQEGAPERRFGLVSLEEVQTAGVETPLLILLAAIGLMLVVGCANLAGLQVARSLARRSEMATRKALGSGTGALVRQMVAENVTMGVLGGMMGIGVCFFAMHGLETLVQAHFGTWQEVRLDGRVLAAALGITALATGLFSLAPILHVRRQDVMRTLLSGSRGVVGKGGHAVRKALLVGEVAMVTALLFAAGLLVRSYGYLEGMDPGFDAQGVLTVQYSLDDARYAESEAVQALFRETLTRIREIPGVASASVALTLPYERPLNLPFRLPGDDEETVRITNAVYVTPGFFRTLDIPLLQGRVLHEGDRAGSPIVAVANQAWVEANVESGQALGIPVSMGFGGGDDVEVVGVVGNVLQRAGWGDGSTPVWETPTLYLASAQAGDAFMQQIHVWFSPSWVIRGEAARPELAAEVTRAFREIQSDLPVARTATLQEVMDRAFAVQRFEATFLLAVAGFALLLAGIGLYGIVAHEVVERRAEMGLRMALGSTPGKAVLTTGLGGLVLTGIGLAVGVGLAVPVGRVMESLLYGVQPFDPVTLVLLAGFLGLFAAVASFVPAARIGRTDPAEVLREG